MYIEVSSLRNHIIMITLHNGKSVIVLANSHKITISLIIIKCVSNGTNLMFSQLTEHILGVQLVI